MKRTPTRIIPKSNLVEPTDVLVCARVLKELPDARLVDANFQFFKLALLEDGRMPADASMLVKPWGLVAPESIKHAVNARMSKDPDVLIQPRHLESS